jgi:hypothetical protein
MRNGCKKVRKVVGMYFGDGNPLENRAKRAKKRAVNAVERILWEDCVWE